jgi:hypothetical protein
VEIAGHTFPRYYLIKAREVARNAE